MKNVITVILSVAALASACGIETPATRRATRDAIADYDATEREHLSENYFAARVRDMTCPYHTPRGVVGIPSYDFEGHCRAFAMTSH